MTLRAIKLFLKQSSKQDNVIADHHGPQMRAMLPGPEQTGLLFKSSIEPHLRLCYAPFLRRRRRFKHGRRAQPAEHNSNKQ